jgi:aldehyde:ferredoxin oxidoreductase
MFGYHGKFLQVDLGTGEIKVLELKSDDLKKFIGGSSLAAMLMYDRIKPGQSPLSPDTPLVFATGPFTGTKVPMVSRLAICGISPLTGIWGESTTGGTFPFKLKASGFDGIVITGKADKPVYLYLNNGNAEIRDASSLWGCDTYDVQKKLKDELQDAGVSVACIGPAGEKLVTYACVMNDKGRAAGRCGLGALMGSKKLKAVVAVGNLKPEPANKEKIAELTKQARNTVISHYMNPIYRELGTLVYMELGMALGDVPAKYFTKSVFPAEKIGGKALKETYNATKEACYGCPMMCGRVVKHFNGIDEVHGPEYETAAAFGPLCMNYDLNSIIMANHICNAYGLDTMSAGVCIAYAMHLYENGTLTRDRAGMEIEWGNGDLIVRLVEMIVNRQGIGALLGEGVRRMAEELKADPEEAAHVKGLELPMHDARAFQGQALCYATGPRGACHLKGSHYRFDLGSLPVPELGIAPSDRLKSEGKAEVSAIVQNYNEVFDALLLCKFTPLSATQISEMLSNITGWDYTPADLNTSGERSINIKRAISNKLGVSREDDRMPRICIQPLKEGSTEGKSPDMGLMLKEYYDYRKWDWETGKPSRQKLVELGLEQAAMDLWPSS